MEQVAYYKKGRSWCQTEQSPTSSTSSWRWHEGWTSWRSESVQWDEGSGDKKHVLVGEKLTLATMRPSVIQNPHSLIVPCWERQHREVHKAHMFRMPERQRTEQFQKRVQHFLNTSWSVMLKKPRKRLSAFWCERYKNKVQQMENIKERIQQRTHVEEKLVKRSCRTDGSMTRLSVFQIGRK